MLENRRILIIEDDLQFLAALCLLLKRHGANIFVDRWGSDSAETFARLLPVDIVLLDLHFPRYNNGFEVCDTLHAIPAFSPTPIVAMTGASLEDVLEKVQQHRFNGLITKPINTVDFPAQIARAIQGESIWP
jgi:CheY-like chemotaxis protein